MTPGSDDPAIDGNQAPPSTTDYVRFHALHRPTAIALINNGREVTYRQFYLDLKKITRALREILPTAGSSVAVECDDLYLHWLLLLACEILGVVTASLQAYLIPASKPLLAFVDFVICEHDVPADWVRRAYKLTQAWVSGVLAQADSDGGEELPNNTRRLSDPRRILRSSGTTGVGKVMVASRALEEVNLQHYMTHMGFSKDSKFLITAHFNVGSMYSRATACLRLGATCVFELRTTVGQAIATHKPTHVRLFQYQVKSVLDDLPTNFQKPDRLTMMLGAGPLPEDMRQRIMARLATDLVYTYNSNETWMIAVVNADGIATLRPGAEVEVVDEQGRPLPLGEVGRFKIKTDSLVAGYANDDEATARVFKDGWFYSSDMGMLVDRRRLKILGRIDDILNIGGMKIVPSLIEDMIIGMEAVKEVGVTSVPGPEGIDEICVALVVHASADTKTVEEFVATKILPAAFGRTHVIAMEKLPRTETGKLQRHLLRAAFQERTSAR